jgi:hypothetical protein
VEAEFLWPLLRGENVDRFGYSSSGLYVIVPNDPEDLTRPLTVDELAALAPCLFDLIEPAIPQLRHRSAYHGLTISDEIPWAILGPWQYLDRATPLVMSRYMHPDKRPPTAVVSPRFDSALGLVTTVYPNNKTNFLKAELAEADYLAAWINSEASQSAIARFVSSTTIPPLALQRLPIPRFDPDKDIHHRISELGRSCREGALVSEDLTERLGELDQLVSASAQPAAACRGHHSKSRRA